MSVCVIDLKYTLFLLWGWHMLVVFSNAYLPQKNNKKTPTTWENEWLDNCFECKSILILKKDVIVYHYFLLSIFFSPWVQFLLSLTFFYPKKERWKTARQTSEDLPFLCRPLLSIIWTIDVALHCCPRSTLKACPNFLQSSQCTRKW